MTAARLVRAALDEAVDSLARASGANAPEARALDLEVSDLHKRFGATPVLAGVDLAIRHGERVALVGANGSGKSTLLRLALGLIAADRGSVRLLGEAVRELRGRRLRRLRGRVGVIWQRHNLVPRACVLSNVLHGAQAHSSSPLLWWRAIAPVEARREALLALETVGVAHLRDRRADHLSGGESQRVAIARALMQRPRLVFADEPVASLDPKVGEQVMRLLAGILRDRGMTLVFISHSIHDALTYAERVVGLRGGRVALDAPSHTLAPADLRSFYD